MQQYLFAVHTAEGAAAPTEEEIQASYARVDVVDKQLIAAGAWVFAGGLFPPDDTTVVRVANGTTTMTDGPYAETKEHMGGFWVIQAEDLDEALAWAEKCATACGGPIEVRPFRPNPADPAEPAGSAGSASS